MATKGSFTISERAPGVWGASYFRGPYAKPADQGFTCASAEDAAGRARTLALIFELPFSAIRVRAYDGQWSELPVL
jgi:hypothetical protein